MIQIRDDVMTGTNTNMAIVDNLTSNENYEFQVKASNSAGDGEASNAAMFATSRIYISHQSSLTLFLIKVFILGKKY